MNNLLDALKGVIGEDEDVDDSDESEEERPAPAEDVRPTPEAELPTEPDPAVPDAPQPTNEAHSDPPPHVVGLHQDREQSPEYEEDSSHSTNSAPTPDILSPVELSHLRLSGLDQLSHAKGNNSFDSGYAEQWQSPRPFALSPPRSPSVVSTFGLLSSPFGSPSERVFGSPLTQRFSNIPPSPLLAASFAHDSDAQNNADVTNLEEDLDSPNAYRASVASSMTMEAATDVTEDLSFEAGEGRGWWICIRTPRSCIRTPRRPRTHQKRKRRTSWTRTCVGSRPRCVRGSLASAMLPWTRSRGRRWRAARGWGRRPRATGRRGDPRARGRGRRAPLRVHEKGEVGEKGEGEGKGKGEVKHPLYS
ncbi:hypothetical protein FB107DRAFT_280721 [Schizophyllum commune]